MWSNSRFILTGFKHKISRSVVNTLFILIVTKQARVVCPREFKVIYSCVKVKLLVLELIICFIIIRPANKVWGVYSEPHVRPSVRSSVRPSQSLIRYSSKTAEQNFMKLSRIVHYMMPYYTCYFEILFEWFWGFPEQNKDFALQNMGERGYHFVSIAYGISSSFCK